MIDLEDITTAYQDIVGEQAEFDVDDIRMRFEMMGINFDDFRIFLYGRLQALDSIYDFHPEWGRGYVHAAMEFFLYGDLCGKLDKLDSEIDGNQA